MNERIYAGKVERLRAPGRLALLEVERVVDLCLAGLDALTALDLGTGTGVFAEAFAGRGLATTGVDLSEDMVAAGRRLVPGVEFLVGRAESVDLPAGSFDVVFLGHLLHEADDPVAMLAQASRLAACRVAVLEWPYRIEDTGPPLEHRLTDDKVRAFAVQAGFERVRTELLAHMVLHLMDK